MKKTVFMVILLASCFSIKAQGTAIKTKTFYWGDDGSGFYRSLTESGKKLVDSLFKHVTIDTINCIKITPEQEIKYLSRGYLSKHNYEYLTIYRYDDVVSIRKYNNVLYDDRRGRKKILLKYSKDFNDEIDRVSLHVID